MNSDPYSFLLPVRITIPSNGKESEPVYRWAFEEFRVINAGGRDKIFSDRRGLIEGDTSLYTQAAKYWANKKTPHDELIIEKYGIKGLLSHVNAAVDTVSRAIGKSEPLYLYDLYGGPSVYEPKIAAYKQIAWELGYSVSHESHYPNQSHPNEATYEIQFAKKSD